MNVDSPDIAVFQKSLATLPIATYQSGETVLIRRRDCFLGQSAVTSPSQVDHPGQKSDAQDCTNKLSRKVHSAVGPISTPIRRVSFDCLRVSICRDGKQSAEKSVTTPKGPTSSIVFLVRPDRSARSPLGGSLRQLFIVFHQARNDEP